MRITHFPKLFCEKGTILRLKKDSTIQYHKEDSFKIEKTEHVSKGTLFKVANIIGYGFDLDSLDSKYKQVRFINSSMPEYFEILKSTHG